MSVENEPGKTPDFEDATDLLGLKAILDEKFGEAEESGNKEEANKLRSYQVDIVALKRSIKDGNRVDPDQFDSYEDGPFKSALKRVCEEFI